MADITTYGPSAIEEATQLGSVAARVQDLGRSFGERRVIDGLDLSVRAGEFVALLGRSGTGKTTLLRILAGLEQADRGIVKVASARSLVFQEPRLVPAKRVWRNVIIGQSYGRGARAAALAALDEVGLFGHADAWPKTLSGGEAQRVALARALVGKPGLLLLDEPFAALDALTRTKMHSLVISLWQRHNPAVVLVTHDADEALLLADRVCVMSEGRIAYDERVELPKPRDRSADQFHALRSKLISQLI